MAYHWEKNRRPGVDDMVLLKSADEEQIKKNLRDRFGQDCIFTYIGPVLISVNPFKKIDIFGQKQLDIYRDAAPYENAPHIYALTDDMYRNMLIDNESHCVIISGESGAGKTVAAKFIMGYITKVSGGNQTVEEVKEVILKSNPLLEAFGNAKTLRNNNSSRFGKYIEIQFNRGGQPIGGIIKNFLLEKSRVLGLNVKERNFHIFYQFLNGMKLQPQLAKNFGVDCDWTYFMYLAQTGEYQADGINDTEEFADTRNAFKTTGIGEEEETSIFQMIAGILHLGNIDFIEDGNSSKIKNSSYLDFPAYLLGIDGQELEKRLLFQNMKMNNIGQQAETVKKSHNVEQAKYSRDALAKAIYSRLFDYLVREINKAMVNKNTTNTVNIGILDIYGFEIFLKNGFEQFCINFVNEKLQQIFIELTLRNEQEEYKREGVKWQDVDFQDNKSICELFEGGGGKSSSSTAVAIGLFSVLDDVCKTLHAVTHDSDNKFLSKLTEVGLTSCRHIVLGGDTFTVSHYAGKVRYNVDGFCERNRDVLNADLIELMKCSDIDLIRRLFPEDVSQNTKRPTTAGTKIRQQANTLVEALMKCTPHYIRCIKPNETKRSGDFDNDRVLHQIKYLGLSENIRVRRAGYSYRREYDKFLQRYAILNADIWGRLKRKQLFSGGSDLKKDTERILVDCQLERKEYEFGTTKIFIKRPDSLFLLEESRARRYDDYAMKIQKWFRKNIGFQYYNHLRQLAAQVLSNQKERRRCSINRKYFGDYIGIVDNPQLIVLLKNRKEKILFAIQVDKYDRRFKSVKRDLILTSNYVYLIGREKVKKGENKGCLIDVVKRLIALKDISKIMASHGQDDFFVMCVKDDYDSFLECKLKTEFFTLISKQIQDNDGRKLAFEFNNTYKFTVKKEGFGGGGSRTVVTQIGGGGDMTSMTTIKGTPRKAVAKLKSSGKSLTVMICNGMPPNSVPTSSRNVGGGKNMRHNNHINNNNNNNYNRSNHQNTNNNNNIQRKQSRPQMPLPASTTTTQPTITATRPAPGPPTTQSMERRFSNKSAPVRPKDGAQSYATYAQQQAEQFNNSDRDFINKLPDCGDLTVRISKNKERSRPKPPMAPKPNMSSAPNRKAKAIYAYTGQDVDELSFNEGDILEILNSDGDWWKGILHGKNGLVPYNYVQLI